MLGNERSWLERMSTTLPTHLFDVRGVPNKQLPQSLHVPQHMLLAGVQLHEHAADVEPLDDDGDEDVQGEEVEEKDEEEVDCGADHRVVLCEDGEGFIFYRVAEQSEQRVEDVAVIFYTGTQPHEDEGREGHQQRSDEDELADDASFCDDERLQQDANVSVEAKHPEHLQHHRHEDHRLQHRQRL